MERKYKEGSRAKKRIITTHPYVVILKSGAKIGIFTEERDIIDRNRKYPTIISVETKSSGIIYLKEIAAIVPIEAVL